MTTPYRDTIPREAPGCSCAAAPSSTTPPPARQPIDWERLGVRLFWAGGMVGFMDLAVLIVLAMADGNYPTKPPVALFWIFIPCAVVMVAGAASWWFSPDGDRASGPPLPPRNWARVGAFTGLGGLLLYLADVFSAWTMCGAITADWPDPCRWLAIPCFVAVAVGVTTALCAPGKALPDLSP